MTDKRGLLYINIVRQGVLYTFGTKTTFPDYLRCSALLAIVQYSRGATAETRAVGSDGSVCTRAIHGSTSYVHSLINKTLKLVIHRTLARIGAGFTRQWKGRLYSCIVDLLAVSFGPFLASSCDMSTVPEQDSIIPCSC